MKKIVLFSLLLLIGILCENQVDILTGTTKSGCDKPCYGENVSPCSNKNQICKKKMNSDDACCMDPKYEYTSYTRCTEPCKDYPANDYKCSHNEVCNCKDNYKCYNCDKKCASTCATLVSPCSVDYNGKQCAARISPKAVCYASECGCNAEWYLDGKRICDKAPQYCPACNYNCNLKTQMDIDYSTGCAICGNCKPTCNKDYCSSLKCTLGYEEDKYGCPLCKCKECPPVCQIYCQYGHKTDPKTGCQLCECNQPPKCPKYKCSGEISYCLHGQAEDEYGCPICKCKESPCPKNYCPNLHCPYGRKKSADGCELCECKQKECPYLKCAYRDCKYGYAKDEHGCPTCNCNIPCFKSCPYGYTYDTEYGQTSCKCNCMPKTCYKPCKYGYEDDIYGCKTCECKKNYQICPKINCDIYCQYGYDTDKNGCPMCKCKSPIVCPKYPCKYKCIYGYETDQYGCPTCQCKPCPPVTCKKYCPFGYKNKYGCPTCSCNNIYICPITYCPLYCKYGYVKYNGCPTCVCEKYPPCNCPNILKMQKLCPDKRNYAGYTNVCYRMPNGLCTWIFKKCPVVIKIRTNPLFKLYDIKSSVEQYVPPDDSITYDESDYGGMKEYRVSIPDDMFADDNEENKLVRDLGEDLRKSYSGTGISIEQDRDSIVEEQVQTYDNMTKTGKASLLVPFLGLMLFLLYI